MQTATNLQTVCWCCGACLALVRSPLPLLFALKWLTAIVHDFKLAYRNPVNLQHRTRFANVLDHVRVGVFL